AGDAVFKLLVIRVARVVVAVGVWRTVVQDEWLPLSPLPLFDQALVGPSPLPGFETVRLSLGQVGPHREGRLRQIERLSIVHGACNLQSIKYVEKGRHESNKKAFRRLRTKGILPRYHLAWMAKKQDRSEERRVG